MNNQLENYLIKLVAFKTPSGLENQKEVLQLYSWFESNLKNTNYSTRIVNNYGYNSLVIEPAKKNKIKYVLLSHVDVVPGKETQFKAAKKGNKLFGRGTSDMKFAVACYLELLNNLTSQNDIKVILTSDEEIGGTNGILALYKRREINAEAVILPDAGSNFQLTTNAKGICQLTIEQRGKSSHASQPWRGKNAITILIDKFESFQKSFPKYKNNQWITTCSLTKIEGGISTNTLPDKASISIDIRFTENWSIEKIIKLANKYFGNDCKMSTLATGDCFKLNKKNKYVKRVIQLIEKSTHRNIELYLDNGTSDARHLVDSKIPVIMFKPNSGGHHTDNEWIDLSSLTKFYNILSKVIIHE